MNTPPPLPGDIAPRKKRGCFFYGCLTLVLLGLFLAIGIGAGVWYVSHRFAGLVREYTATEPAALPVTQISPAEYESLEKRVADFGEALRQNAGTNALALDAAELNALLQRSPAASAWKDQLHLALEGNSLRAQISLPLDQLGASRFLRVLRGRYLNGSASLAAALQAGQLDVRLKSIEVGGVSLPAEVMANLSQHNLAVGLYQQPQIAAVLTNLARLEITDGRVVLTPRSP